ncbi:hypothetical protein JOM56_001075 [Amanita muscaria]
MSEAVTRQLLLASGCYLGVEDYGLAEKLVWERVGNTERLVTEAASEIAAAECWAFFNSGRQGRVPQPPGSVVLSAVVSVAAEDYRLTPCAMWPGPCDGAPALADVTASCVGVAPKHVAFADDFVHVLRNIRQLMEAGHMQGLAGQTGLLVGGGQLEFHHALFEPVYSSQSVVPGTSASVPVSDCGALPAELSIAGWPGDCERTRDALKSMITTHRVNYVEAFDMHGRLIAPGEYRKHIQGALVQMHFTLRHWTVLGQNARYCDAFAADIFSLRVLEPPSSYGLPVVPRKQKFYKLDPLTPDIFPKTLEDSAEGDAGNAVVKGRMC